MNEYMQMLGVEVKDRVTGFKGVVTTVSFDLYGCVQCVVGPKAGKDGKLGDSHWFDAKRLEVKSAKPVMPVPSFGVMQAGDERGPAEKPAQSSAA